MIINFTSSHHCIDKLGKPHRIHCRACRGDQKWRELVGAPLECPHGVTLDDLPADKNKCIHRGGEVRRVECPTCQGKVMAVIKACAIHIECSQFSKPLGVKQCQGCSDIIHLLL